MTALLNAMTGWIEPVTAAIDCPIERDAMIISQEIKEYIGDDWMQLQSVDYLEPIYRLTLERAIDYSSKHRCPECREQLIAVDDGDKYQIVCPEGHEVSERTALTNHQVELAESAEHSGQLIINAAQSTRTEAEIMKELGF